MSKMSYDDAVRHVQKLKRVVPDILAVGSDWSTSTRYLAQMERDGIVGPMDKLGWRDVLPAHSHSRGNGREHHADRPSEKPHESTAGATRLNDPERIAELEAQVARLKSAGQTLIAQREEWKARALAAEKKASSGSSGGDSSRYAALKRVLARELHPDYAAGDGIERVVREAIFKRIWPKVEDIEKSA